MLVAFQLPANCLELKTVLPVENLMSKKKTFTLEEAQTLLPVLRSLL
jgi:hypothetical protein